jgi:transcriptional regulator with GAF, ATPase, and Fis domain
VAPSVPSGSFSVVHALILHASNGQKLGGGANRGITVLDATRIHIYIAVKRSLSSNETAKLDRALSRTQAPQSCERENLFAVLQKTGWKIKDVDGAAELLGLTPTTLMSRMEKMGLKRPARTKRCFSSTQIVVSVCISNFCEKKPTP